MKKLLIAFRKNFGRSFPKELIPGDIRDKLIPLDGRPIEESLLVGSEQAAKSPALIQGDISKFLKSAPKGYLLNGFWGHGVNSYAFYYSRVDSWSRIFFRLGYGGVYMDNKLAGLLIGQFLESFAFHEQRLRRTCKRLVAVESMGEAFYRITKKDGSCIEHNDPLMYSMDIGSKIGSENPNLS